MKFTDTFEKALNTAKTRNEKLRCHINSFTITPDMEGVKFVEEGISICDGEFIIPWVLVGGFSVFGDNCDGCGKFISEDERHSEQEWNFCKECGEEMRNLNI